MLLGAGPVDLLQPASDMPDSAKEGPTGERDSPSSCALLHASHVLGSLSDDE